MKNAEYKLSTPGYYREGKFLQTLTLNGHPTGYAATSSPNNFSYAALTLAMKHINEGSARIQDYTRIFLKTL